MTVSHTLSTEVQHSVELCAAFYLHRVRVQDLEGANAAGVSMGTTAWRLCPRFCPVVAGEAP